MSSAPGTPTRSLATPVEVAEHLGISEPTLRQWRYLGTGPKFIRVGKHVRYRWADVEAYLSQQTVVPAANVG